MSDEELYRSAHDQAGRLAGLYRHALVYVLVNLLLIGINLLTGIGTLWCVWPLLGWGLGLAIHAAGVFGNDSSWVPTGRNVRRGSWSNGGPGRD